MPEVLDQELCHSGVVSKEYDFFGGKTFTVEYRAMQTEREVCIYLASASMEVEDFFAREKASIVIDVSFGSRFTSEAYYLMEKRLVVSLGPGFFAEVFRILIEKGRGKRHFPWADKRFRLCIGVERRNVFASSATIGFGFGKIVAANQSLVSFQRDQFRQAVLDWLLDAELEVPC